MVLAAAVLVFSAVGAANLLALQTAAPPAVETQQSNGQPAREQPSPAPDETGAGNASPQPADEILQIENRLRRELLDDRARMLDWWLMGLSLLIVAFGIFAYTRFRTLESDASKSVELSKQHAEEARKHLETIEQIKQRAERLDEMTAEAAAENPAKAREAAEIVRQDPAASPIGRAFAAAISLQGQGKIEDAIRKWRSIADVTEGIDKDIEARAWFSVGYLCQEKSEKPDLGEVVHAYDKALRLKPELAEAYNNRGNAKNALGRYKEAIADLDEAIRLNPDYAKAYSNRGIAKNALGRHEKAIADLDEAIRLKPDYAEAYNNRGVVKGALDRYEQAIADFNEALSRKPDFAEAYNNRGNANALSGRLNEARKDYQTALDLARKQGKEEVAAKAKRALEKLGEEKSS